MLTTPSNEIRPTVLIVEDDYTQRFLLKKELGDLYELVFADDSQVASMRIHEKREKPFSLAIVDWRMPPSYGLPLVDDEGRRVLREIGAAFPFLRVVVTTSSWTSEEVRAAIRDLPVVIVDIVMKPLSYKVLARTVGDALGCGVAA